MWLFLLEIHYSGKYKVDLKTPTMGRQILGWLPTIFASHLCVEFSTPLMWVGPDYFYLTEYSKSDGMMLLTIR